MPFIIHILWLLFGSETIACRHGLLIISRKILGIAISKKFLLHYIQKLSLLPYDHSSIASTRFHPDWSYQKLGTISFDYKAQEIKFGLSLSQEEAKYICTLLETRFAAYKQQ